MKKSYLFLAFLILFPKLAFSETPQQMAQAAEQAYTQGDYQESIKLWEELLELGFKNADLFNNLGSGYWRVGKVGPARYYFLKARALEPRDGEIFSNLKYIEEKLNISNQKRQNFLQKWVPWYKLRLNMKESLMGSAVFTLLFFLFLFMYQKSRGKLKKTAIGIFAILAIFSLSQLSYFLYKRFFDARGVILAPSASFLSAPTEEAKTGRNLDEGHMVEIKRIRGDYTFVQTPDGVKGWINNQKIGEI